jgi:hypothetical protein
MPPSSAAGFTRRPSTPPSRLLPRRVVAFVVLGPQVLLQGQLSLAFSLIPVSLLANCAPSWTVTTLLDLAADLLPPIVDDQEPRRGATFRQAAHCKEFSENLA